MGLLFAALVLSAPEVAPPEFFAPNEELRAYLLEAADNSPELHRLYAEWRAALERLPQVKSLDDPQFTYTQFVQSDQTRFGVALMQEFPWFGTLQQRGDAAAAEAEAALWRLYAARNRLFEQIKEAYHEYAFLAQSLETTRAEARLLTEMEDNVGTRYGLGLASEADLLRVQMEQSTLEDRYNEFLQRRPVLSARLTTLVGREAAEELPWPQPAALPPSPPPAAAVLARLRALNPDLEEMDRVIEGRRVSIELARKSGRPNFTVGLEYQDMKQPDAEGPEWPYMAGVEVARGVLAGDAAMVQGARDFAINSYIAEDLMPGMDPMSDDVMVSVGVTLPIWRQRVRAGIAEAKELEQAAVSEKRSRTLALDVEAREAVFQMRDARRRYNLYTDVLIPRARQTYESLQSRYSAGEQGAAFLDVLGSVQVLLNYELEQLRAARDLQVGAARLERVMGGPWGIEEAEPEPEPVSVPEAAETEEEPIAAEAP